MSNTPYLLAASDEELKRKFFALSSPEDVAELLEVEHRRLRYHLYKIPDEKRYTTYNIAKKSGGVRKISAPITAIKIIQRKLNYILQLVYKAKPSVYGFVLNRNIVHNAEAHSRKHYVFNIDLKDFFPSINFGRVRGTFIAKPYNLSPEVSTVLAQICCSNNELPQGAPTSPVVSNMICAKMDSELLRLAKKYKCYYTRYADDITFSTNLKTFPSALATANSINQIDVGSELLQVINDNGFQINNEKVRLQVEKLHCQEVTGLTVNKLPNVRRTYIRQVRAMLHAWEKFGLEKSQEDFEKKYYKKTRRIRSPAPLFQHVLKGKIAYIGMVRGKKDPIFIKYWKQLRNLDPDLVKGIEEIVEFTKEDIEHQCELLETYRKKLRYHLGQEAVFGISTPYPIHHEINDCRENIRRIKSTLRQWGVKVENHSCDDPHSNETPEI